MRDTTEDDLVLGSRDSFVGSTAFVLIWVVIGISFIAFLMGYVQ